MTETTKSGDKLSVNPTKTLTLKRGGVEQGVVRQSFSHGRSKAVVVEKVKRRIGPGEARAEPVAAPAASSGAAQKRPSATPAMAKAPATAAPASASSAAQKSGVVLRTLTEEERSARAHALAGAQLREHEERERAEHDAAARRVREEAERTERAASEARKLNEENRRKHDEETKRKADEVAKNASAPTRQRRPGRRRLLLPATRGRRWKPTRTKHRAQPAAAAWHARRRRPKRRAAPSAKSAAAGSPS
jgi:translation initiation factor IF-2